MELLSAEPGSFAKPKTHAYGSIFPTAYLSVGDLFDLLVGSVKTGLGHCMGLQSLVTN